MGSWSICGRMYVDVAYFYYCKLGELQRQAYSLAEYINHSNSRKESEKAMKGYSRPTPLPHWISHTPINSLGHAPQRTVGVASVTESW